ncbi:reverse transcriptase domain-containing protein [Nephila pilipes]|uniref:Reverse transcriptase domain-containing protein n=1 Tax=Nephila pilipes TaxID=299642 RepID=A0A8X6Q7A5_NEPPI|nr:reverse transcriptase domain-containing protein [Nephila pilipes]
MELDRLRKKRKAFKSSTTKLTKRNEESKNSDNSSELDELLNLLQNKIDNIKILDDQIVDLIDVNDTETEIRKPTAYSADIEKALIQIMLYEQDRDVARFFWTENPSDYDPKHLQVYRLTRVLFGLTSNPFMLATIIKHHLEKYKDKYPDTAEIVQSSLYVDDFISGQENVDKALQTSLESTDIFEEAGMSLRKWNTNSKELERLCTENKVPVEDSNCLSELGVVPLRAITRVFDPVGFLSPVVIRLKLLLQDIWTSGIDWDEELPCSLKSEWIELCSEIPELKSILIPRYYLWNIKDEVESLALHSFSDSSKRGYGCVTYLWVVCKNGNVGTSFISSKSRESPLKTGSLPRLELLGALLLVRLASRIAKSFKYKLAVYYWTDSTIVYCWVKSCPDKFKPFVKNRLEEIQKISGPSC